MWLIHFYSILSIHDFIDLLWNSLPLSAHILFGFLLDSFKNFWKALVIVIPFSSFKRRTHVYLLKISMTYNEKQIPLLNVLINCISARSAPQILSIKGECTYLFLSFLIIDLCNYSANSFFEIFSFLMP